MNSKVLFPSFFGMILYFVAAKNLEEFSFPIVLSMNVSFSNKYPFRDDCVAIKNNDDGFKLAGGNNTVRDCTAIGNGSEGFRIDNGNDVDNNNVIRGCSAVQNGSEGFNIDSDENEIRDCSSVDNNTDGFQIGGSNNVLRDIIC